MSRKEQRARIDIRVSGFRGPLRKGEQPRKVQTEREEAIARGRIAGVASKRETLTSLKS